MTANGLIVIIEDEPDIADLLEAYLRKDGFAVVQATTGERGLELVQERDPRLVLLDVGLAGTLDGLDVCRTLRANSKVPVVMVTARGDEIDRILGLELGADDYVAKPFSPRELVARIKAVLRRTEPDDSETSVIELGSLRVDVGRHEARLGDEPISLAAREFSLLAYLAQNRGRALSRAQLLDGAWGADWFGDERTVDVHVRQLRRKLGDALDLHTVRGVGYRLD